MHYTIDYSKLEGDAKREAALNDIKNYLGEKKFGEISKEALEIGGTAEDFKFRLAIFAGIQGYPATAWAEYCGLKSDKED